MDNDKTSFPTPIDTNRRPRFSVEEVSDTSVVGVVNQIPDQAQANPSQEFSAQPSVPEASALETARPFSDEVQNTQSNPPITTEVQSSPPQSPVLPTTAPQVVKKNNFSVREHPLRTFLFLIPALLIIATIYLVAKFTGNNYTLREPEPTFFPSPTAEPTLTPTPTPAPTPNPSKKYKNESLLIMLEMPADYEVLSESKNSVSLGRGEREILVITKAGKEYDYSKFAANENEEEEIEKIIESIVVLIDTSDWKTFENKTFGYVLRYPSDWTLNAPQNKDGIYTARSEITKNMSDKSVNNLVIETTANVGNAAFTASEIASSTRTLSGWKGQPKTELKRLGGGDAQVIQGELSGKWRAYVVVWYKNTVVQMTWDDFPNRPQEQVFENILASFEFKN